MTAQSVVVIGAGVSGLAAAFRISERFPDTELTVLEKDDHVGGTARSERAQGYTFDWGPNGFLTNVPHTVDLAAAVGLTSAMTAATPAIKRRYLYRDDQLKPLPSSPLAFAKTDLLPARAKMRLIKEPWVEPPAPGADETVFEFGTRHFGEDFAEAFLRPMVMGITAGDAKEVSLAALFPRMKAMEKTHGSLVKAMFAKMREKKRQTDGPAGPFGRLTTFGQGGMQALSTAIREHLGDRIKGGAAAQSIERLADRWRVHTNGDTYDAESLVLAVPAHVAAPMLRPHDADLADTIDTIPYVGVRVFGLGFDKADVSRDLDGFGFLAPPGGGIRLLGCVWTSALFPDQAPVGKVSLRIITGGRFDPEIVDMTEDKALDAVRQDLRRSMGIQAEPEFTRQIRWARAIPQYTRGHLERLGRINAAVDALPGLYLTGNAFRGVSLNDCVKDGLRVANDFANA